MALASGEFKSGGFVRDQDGRVVMTGVLQTGDIQIGSVELQDKDGTNRAVIDSSGALSGNITKLGGLAINLGAGNAGTGTQRVVLATDQAQLTNALKVEQQFSSTRVTADGQIKGSAGFVHTITIAPTTATPTAGLLTVYDSLTETGTVLYSEWIFATTPGHSVTLDATASTGIYVGYDAALANVSVTVSYR